MRKSSSKHNLVGQRFGELLVVEYVENPKRHPARLWRCLCDCGQEFLARTGRLLTGSSYSCVTCMKSRAPQRARKHGLYKTPEYKIWEAMRHRCSNSCNKSYKRYGGRGIFVTPEWDDFSVFYRDMGPRPFEEATLERKDNDGPYSKENCRWATQYEQAHNRSNNVWITYKGKTQCLSDWSRELGIERKTLGRLLKSVIQPKK